MKPIAIDAFDFSRLGERRAGELAVTQLPRLAAECVDTTGTLQWALEGGLHASGHPQLVLQVEGAVKLVCQRCLKPFMFSLLSTSVLVLARDEEQADQVEAALEDDGIDVIVGSRSMNLTELIEDEALLTLPLAPKHAQCTEALIPDSSGEAIELAKPSPFAALKNIKH